MGKSRYLIFRDYTKRERPDPRDRTIFYGWTDNKNVADAFMQQRSPKKYIMKKSKFDEDTGVYILKDMITPVYDDDEENVRINYLELTSSITGEKFILFMTRNEMQQAEINIQKMLHAKTELCNVKGDANYAAMIISLKKEYADALHAIGYRPPDIDYLFPNGEDYSGINEIVDNIESAYGDSQAYYSDFELVDHAQVLGSFYQDRLYTKVIYSIESFIMVLRDDL